MTKPTLLKKLDSMLDEVERTRAYGKIEIEYRAGKLTFLNKTEQEKLDEVENHNYARQTYR